MIGAGFLAATFLVRPFLPGQRDNSDICGGLGNLTMAETEGEVGESDAAAVQPAVPTIAWPFIISGVWCMVTSLGFLLLARLPYTMPRYYEQDKQAELGAGQEAERSIPHWKPLLMVVFLYYFVSCGVERIFQSMVPNSH